MHGVMRVYDMSTIAIVLIIIVGECTRWKLTLSYVGRYVRIYFGMQISKALLDLITVPMINYQ